MSDQTLSALVIGSKETYTTQNDHRRLRLEYRQRPSWKNAFAAQIPNLSGAVSQTGES